MPLKSPSLFWRTFTLLMLLLIITALAWLQSFRVLSEVPFSKGVSQQIISTVNLTRYALISSDPNARPDLLHVLAIVRACELSRKKVPILGNPYMLKAISLNSLTVKQKRS